MPSKEFRKVIAVGDSDAVTLPKPFKDYHDIKSGDEVELIYDNFILIRPKNVPLTKRQQELIDALMGGR